MRREDREGEHRRGREALQLRTRCCATKCPASIYNKRDGMRSYVTRFITGIFFCIIRKCMAIALFTVNSSHLHYNIFAPGCEAVSGKKCKIARNCLTSTFKNIVMQMRKGNREKGYWERESKLSEGGTRVFHATVQL